MSRVLSVETNKQFREIASGEGVAVLFFSATWCQPCQQCAKTIERLAFQFEEVVFAKIDADDLPDILEKCRVTVLPTFMLTQAGQQVGFVIGAEMDELRAQIKTALRDDFPLETK